MSRFSDPLSYGSDLARGRFARKFFRNLGAISAPNARRNLGAIWGSVARSDQNCMAILKKIGNGDETWRKKTRSQDFGDFPRIQSIFGGLMIILERNLGAIWTPGARKLGVKQHKRATQVGQAGPILGGSFE